MALTPLMAASTVATQAADAAAKVAKKTENQTDETNATLNYDSFLKLLVAQMKNQDPTDPVDSSQQMAQLASFSQVEQTIKTNKNLIAMMQQNSLTQASDLIGRTVTSADGKISGIVKAVEVNTDGLKATLLDGNVIPIGTGITISLTQAPSQ